VLAEIPYTPRPWASALHDSVKRWIVLVLHRRAGKTTAALNHLQRDALKIPNSRFAYIAPTYKQAKNVAWDLIKFYARVIPGVQFNEAELTVKYPNGSKLTLYGADNPDSLRGIGLWGVVFDEYSQQPSNIFSEIIRPALADHNGYAIWIGTPKGKNEFFRLYEQGKLDDAWLSLLLTVEDTQLIATQELDDARKVMSADEFLQEWFCSFEAAIKGAIYAAEIAKARSEKRMTVVPYDEGHPVFTVWDLGIGRNMAVGFYQRIAGKVLKIDYWEGTNDEGLPQTIKVIKDKPYVYGKHFGPHDIAQKDVSTGTTRLETAKKLGIAFEIVPKVSVADRIHAGRLLWNRLLIDAEKCKYWLDAIGQWRRTWDDKRGMFLDQPYHDWTSHGADEYTYAALVEEQMKSDDKDESIFYSKQKPYED